MDINVDNIKMGIKEILMDLLKCSNDFLDAEKSFLEIGINSIQSVELVESINQKLGLKLGIDAVFDYTNINELAGYIFDQFRIGHCDKRISMVGDTEEGFRENNLNCMENAECLLEDFPTMDKLRVIEPEQYQVSHDPKAVPEKKESSISVGERGSDIAIIGISGRFAGAENVEEFWNHLQAGDNCIEEINRKGWDESKYYSPDPGQVDRAVSKWGGLLNNIEEFDALFFNISPLEAERMDPQQRLFLQEAYRVFEDAGYSAEELSGRKVGVFVGGRTSDYKEKTLLTQERNSQTFLGNDMSILAARISYFLNLKGPNIAIDTACSSSLVAIHLACESIHSGRSEMALAGGVFVLSSPEFYVMASKTEMLSPDGQCKTFDNRANGIALGEGVGVLLMKKLEQAVADGDYIYGVIKGSSINQDGRTKGITAPSMLSQKALLYDAYKNAAIHPETVSFIETHGTGTKLGDPIEVKALTEAFQMFTNKSQFCAIGSHKPNFGHAIISAGIAGVLKVLMAMKYRKLPPQINITEVNEHIDLNKSPFFINRELREWKSRDGGPLRAGVSAFGFSGTNCHAIIEEAPIRKRTSGNAKPCYLFPLSAKTKDALERKIADMIHWFEEKVQNERADEISYTLLAGRSHFSARCIFIAEDLYELQQQLIAVAKSGLAEFSFREEVKGLKDYGEQLMAELREDRSINAETYKEKLSVLSELYISGYTLNWANLFDRSRRVPLPTYPFAREHYWIPDVTSTDHSRVEGAGAFMPIHPLVQRNTSDLSEQRFSSTFTGQEFFLKDHVVKGKKVLPGAAYIEMARAAVEEAAGGGNEEKTRVRLTNMVWMRPILVDTQAAKIHIGLYPEPTGEITYEIYDEAEVYSKGNAVLISGTEAPDLDIEAWKTRCNRSLFSSGQCYETFKEMGMEYGPGHRGIDTVYLGENQVLAKLSLPSTVSHTRDQYIVHPSLLDSALQASSYLLMEQGEGTKTMLPFALQEVEVIDHCTPAMWALIRYHTGSANKDKIKKIDIDLCNETGKICIKIKGFSTRVLEEKAGAFETAAKKSVLLFHPCWKEKASTPSIPPLYEQRLVILCEPDQKIQESIEGSQPEIQHLVLQCQVKGIEERFQAYAIQIFEQIQIMMKNKRKENILIQIVVVKKNEGQLFSGLSGLLKTAQLENPKLRGQIIEVDREEETGEVVKKVEKNSYSLDFQIRYQNGKRYVMEWKEIEDSQEKSSIPWKDQGVYLITGGIGGLGRIFTREIISKAKDTTIILTGRSPLNEEKRGTLKELEAKGGKIEYKQVDVTDKKGIAHLIQSITKEYGNLHGIIHGAGIIQDNFIFKKSKEEMQKVISPKVSGLVNLDEASKGLPLDFFIFFSSIAGSLGNAGQSDYSVANAFMDSYANYRNELVGLKERYGRTLSVNWPLWKEGGMHVDEEVAKRMLQKMGMLPLETAAGIQALYRGLSSGVEQVMVLEGERQHLHFENIGQPVKVSIEGSNFLEKSEEIAGISSNVLREKTIRYIKMILSSVLKLSMYQMEENTPFEKYGIDSILVLQLTDRLEKDFGSLPKTLFFEYQTIQELSEYFLETYYSQLVKIIGYGENTATSKDLEEVEPIFESKPGEIRQRHSRFISVHSNSQKEKSIGTLDIAVIGVAGRYPGAKNLHDFWEILRNGKDCITEIPGDRWDHSLYYTNDKTKSGKTYSKWGGFLEGVDQFDPLFFNISPREAEFIDPQERLFLECVFETLEDAGYTRNTLTTDFGGNVGVYAGVMYEEYPLYGAQETIQGRPVALWGSPSSIANRVSYFCNFNGPSMAVDTMCSSSLTAIHLACQSLQRGECKLAIAGGVNVSIHPNKYLFLAQGNFISSKGRCESFGEGGDGYVPGEGVGTVLLKPLAKAIADGDQIYGVIKATAINHGGKTNGYTVPNPHAQAGVIGKAIEDAGISPRAISYLEAHGTGTFLGDPIEIAGLTTVFRKNTKDKQFCAIGSVKSNIGHCESAAGISGITKVLLQLKYHQLVPSLHSKRLNSNIDFKNTPFVVQQTLEDWKRPIVEINGEKIEYPRIAGVSSFGAGGSNAHVVIEEYAAKELVPRHTTSYSFPMIIVLSAKNEERLKEQVQQLLNAIEKEPFSDDNLADIAYTLQVGREAMEERLAVIAGSIHELERKLKDFLKGRADIAELYRGQGKRNKEVVSIFATDEDTAVMLDTWIKKEKYDKVLELWVKGVSLDWNRFYRDFKPHRISLPTYPFARSRYWIPDVTSTDHSRVEGAGAFIPIHPLVQRNTSDLSEQRFSSTFTGQEFFLKDHVVKGKKVLPGAAYIEMARAAVEEAAGGGNEEKTRVRLTNMVWMRPILVDTQAAKIHIGLYPEPTGEITYEIYDEAEVYSKGNAVLISGTEAPDLDIEAWKTRCNRSLFSSGQCYETFKEMGMEYGPGHRGIDTVYLGENQVLAKLSLPSTVSHTRDQYIVHPSLLDSALQASSYLLMEQGEGTKTMLPFALQEVEVIDHCTPAMWALIRYHTGSANKDKIKKIDIDLCNETGKICIKIKGFSTRVLEEKAGAFETAAKKSVLLFHPCWKEKASTPSIPPLYEQRLVILCEPDQKIQESIEGSQPEIQHLVLQCQVKGIEERFQAYAIQIFEQIQIMMKNKRKENILIQIVVVKKNEGQLFSGLSGLLKTAQLENPKLRGQIIEVDREEETGEVVKKVEKNSYSLDFQIRYQNGKRYVMEWKEIEDPQENSSIPWKDQGVYLITGGIGGLGRIFTREIISKAKDTTIILTGRSPLNEEKRGTLKELEAKGGKIEYKQVDVTDKKGIAHLIQSITKEYGNLHGIIHGAGIIQDNFIFKKSKEEMQKVISPKVSGLVNLDEASKGLPLDFFIFFSSIAGSLGNAGQSDYSVANAFMDSYANYRNELVGLKERYGRTLSVNWPLWKEGGMHVDEEVAKRMLQKMGILPLETAAGIQALYRGLASGAEQVMVLEGECQHLREFFTGFSPTKEATPSVTQEYKIGFTIEEDLFQEKISDYFRKIIASTIKVPMKEIDAEDPMDEYGIDSIIAMQITSNLEEIFGSLPKTLFFEYQNIKELTAYFFEFHSKQLLDLLGIREEETTVLREFEPIIESVKSHEGSNCSRPRFIASREESRGKEEKNNGDIAIIGVSGRYPGAKNIGELWTNLQAGRDCITEVPKERWDYHTYYDEDKNKSGKTYCKWGGFLENSDRFDSLFFAISPEEAKFMNPQDRLFMEIVWNLFESAGYTRESLKHQYQTRVGVYVGSMYQDYDSKSSSINELSTFMCSSIANRISQYFNLQGPSVVIDSMSSSSAIAIHMACESLIRGECRLAIAGGVNLLYLQKYLRLSKIKMIGSHIHSRSFGDGDGYLPAEGVGAVLLKSLTQAIKDGDRILAVIKSSVTNHGGHTNGAATPNINAQIQLIEDNFKKTGMDPRTISYVEAAANGFPVGDLIEISALDKAFHKFTNDQQFCAIGSIKANIGHAEAASGVSQLTKVILQLQHQQLVPAIGTETLNPNIHFEKTPFYIQRKLTEWKRPMVWIDGEEREVPRRATVSSFGAGGSNVHLIVEEYIPSQNETIHVRSQISPQVVVLSAKNQERLLVACQQMLAFIECREELFLQDIAYTLQVGREAMESRVAMVVNNREELIQGLKEYLKHPKERACVPIFAGNLEEEHEMKNLFSGNTGEKFSQVLLAEKNLKKIAMYWSQGGKIPWDSFHEQNEVRKIFLPSYPFEECHVVSI